MRRAAIPPEPRFVEHAQVWVETYRRQSAVEARYREAWIDVPLKLSRQFSHQDAILSVIAEKSEAVAAVQRAVEAGRVTEADAAALNELSDSALAEFPAYKTLRKKANRLSVRKEDHIMQDKKEETTAADAGREAGYQASPRLRKRITRVEPAAMRAREAPPMVMSSWPLAPVRGSWGTDCFLFLIWAL